MANEPSIKPAMTAATESAPGPARDRDWLDLDLRGLKCPLPVLRTRKALEEVAPGAAIIVSCTDPMAAIDIPHLLNERGDSLEAQERRGDVLVFTIRKAAS